MKIAASSARGLAPAALLLCAATALSQAPTSPRRIAEGVLGRFVGDWTVTGTTLGKPTRTGAQVREEFNGSFIEVHIVDPAKRNPYEARVFLGEKANGDVVVHWLDGTGAETSQTLGTGSIAGNVVTLTFPYPEGTFRDKLFYDPGQDRWRLFIKTGPAHHPRIFSDWYFDRGGRRPPR